MRKILNTALLVASFQTFAADGGFVLSITNPNSCPEYIALYADGVEVSDKNKIKVTADKTTIETSFFIHQLPAGTYWLKGYMPAAKGDLAFDLSRTEIEVAAIDQQRNRIEVKAGEIIDLGRLQIDSLGGNLSVAIPDSLAPKNADLAMSELRGIQLPISTMQFDKLSSNEAIVFERSKNNISLVKSIVELDNGKWIALTSNGKLLTSLNGGDWSISSLISGERVVDYSIEAKLLITEFGRIWSLQNPTSPNLVGQAPASTLPYDMACNVGQSCVIAAKRGNISDEQSMDVYVFEKPNAEWKQIITLPWKAYLWSGQMPAMQFVQKANEVAILHGKNQLTTLELGTLAQSTQVLPFNISQLLVTAGRINIGEHYSDDLGKTWQESNKRLRDGVVQVSSDGTAYVSSFEISMSAPKPIIRRTQNGNSNWETLGPLPASGDLRVGRFSKSMYLVVGGNASTNPYLWKSNDGGNHWAPDLSFNQVFSP